MSRFPFPVLVTLLLGLLAAPVAAQEKYPSRPIDFIVTWGTGGGADAMARQLGTLSSRCSGWRCPSRTCPAPPAIPGSPRSCRASPTATPSRPTSRTR